MTAAGNEEQIEKAKNVLTAALIGLVIILLAYTIVFFVISKLLGEGGSGVNVAGIGNVGGPSFSGSLSGGIIESHYPSRGGTGVPRNTKIIITFKEEIDKSSLILDSNNSSKFGDSNADKINSANIKIYKTADAQLSPNVPYVTAVGIVTLNSKTFVLKPDALFGNPNTPESYTVFLDSGIKKQNGDKAFGLSGNYVWSFDVSTVIDVTPPKVESVIPFPDSTEARNIVVQVNFNEAMDPTSVTGVVPDFTNLLVSTGSQPVGGDYRISNQYKTVEFVTSDKCGVNSCGQDVFCLPGDKKFTSLIKAATTPSNFPYDGAVDIVGNSLDGDDDGKAEGGNADDYAWQFSTNNIIDISAPTILTTTPVKNVSSVSLIDPVEIMFSKLMLFSTLNADNIIIKVGQTIWDRAWWFENTNVDSNNDTKPDRTKTLTFHDKFDNNTNYTVDVKSGVRDVYQNCYSPSKGP